jgi:DNA-3-methyladenine glycosylase
MANSSTKSSKNDSVKRLPASFYSRSTLIVAPDLLGKLLHVQSKEGLVSGRIVETEAYRADDPASHSCRGQTPRATIMFGQPGVTYVYFIYGMYEMLNFVTEPLGNPGAVLIRAVEPVAGEALMKVRRATARTRRDLTSGPGKLCRAFGIGKSHNGASLQGPEIWLEDDGYDCGRVLVSPRIGISKGQDRLWRFFLDKNEFVSRSPMNKRFRVYE